MRTALLHSSEHPRADHGVSRRRRPARRTEAEWDARPREHAAGAGVGRAIEERTLMGEISAGWPTRSGRRGGPGAADGVRGDDVPQDDDVDDVEVEEAWAAEPARSEDPPLVERRGPDRARMRWADGGPGGEGPDGVAGAGTVRTGRRAGAGSAGPGGFPFGLGGSSSARGGARIRGGGDPACRAAAPCVRGGARRHRGGGAGVRGRGGPDSGGHAEALAGTGLRITR